MAKTTNPTPMFTGKVHSGNAAGRGGATNSTGIGPIGTYALGTTSTNPTTKTAVGKKQPAC